MRSFYWVVLCIFSFGSFSVNAEENCETKPVTEVVAFKLVEGVAVSEFKASAAAVEKELRKMPGYQRRQLLRNDAGDWVDIVNWKQLAMAKAAADSMQENPVAQTFFSAIDPQSVVINYYCE